MRTTRERPDPMTLGQHYLIQKHTLYEAIAEAEEPMAGMWLIRLI